MAIKNIHISNFKSFREIDIELGKFNVLVGANASGKSNFVQIFRFLGDIADKGLANAISLQGSEYLVNMRIGGDEAIFVSAVFDAMFARPISSALMFDGTHITYSFALRVDAKTSKAQVSEETFVYKGQLRKWNRKTDEMPASRHLGEATWTIRRVETKYEEEWQVPRHTVMDEHMWTSLYKDHFAPDRLLVEHPFFRAVMGGLSAAIYDFDPKLPKKAVPVAGKATLEEDGNNLAIVLKEIFENAEKKRKFSNLVKDVLPFIEDIRAGKFADKYLLAEVKEKWFAESYLPASFMSDGTIHISALIAALYFSGVSAVILEEPERNIHPQLIARIVQMLKDVSNRRQVIVTTHNSEVVKHAGIENLLFVSRDANGFSTIMRPAENRDVKVFLANEMGVEDLFIQNLLGM